MIRLSAPEIAVGGFLHTFWLLHTDSDTYLLERLVEGVRLMNASTIKVENDLTKPAVTVYSSTEDVSSQEVAIWIMEQTESPYHLVTNNCIHFATQFGSRFGFNHDMFENWNKVRRIAAKALEPFYESMKPFN